MDRLTKFFGVTRLGFQVWLVSIVGMLLADVPGDNYAALRFVGTAMQVVAFVYFGRKAWRWVLDNGAKRTAQVVGSWVPYLALAMWWLYGPWWWPLRVAVGFLAMFAAMFVWAMARAVVEVRRETRP